MKTKIAVTYENGEVFQHFGHTKEFKFYTVEDKKIVDSEIVPTMGSGHSMLADFLLLNGVTVLICGGIGAGARAALDELGIRLYPGVTGVADESVDKLLAGSLDYNPDTSCSHHHEDGHDCGSNHCNEDKQGCAGNHS